MANPMDSFLQGKPAYTTPSPAAGPLAPAPTVASASASVPKPNPTVASPVIKAGTAPTAVAPTAVLPTPADLALSKGSGVDPGQLQTYMAANPGIQADAAIGNILMLQQKQSPTPVAPPSTVPTAPTDLTQGTGSARDTRDVNKSTATDLYANISGIAGVAPPTAPGDPNADPSVIAAQQARDAAAKAQSASASGQYSPQELAMIQADEAAARAKYQFMVDAANSSKERDFAKNIVAMGQNGGLMSTQMVGMEAIPEVVTHPSNVSMKYGFGGGEIGFIQSNYDRAINQATQSQDAAIQEARQSAIKAIQTGKKDDLTNAQQAFENAQKSFMDKQKLASDYSKDMLNYAKTAQDMQKQQMDMTLASDKAGVDKMKALAQSGVSFADIPQADIQKIQEEHGWTDFETKAYFHSQEAGAKKDNYKTEIKGEYMIMSGYNPTTGKMEVTTEKIQGLPPNVEGKFTQKVDGSGSMWLIPDVPDTTKPIADQMFLVGKPGQFKTATGTGSSAPVASVPGFKPDEVQEAAQAYFDLNNSWPSKAEIPFVTKSYWDANKSAKPGERTNPFQKGFDSSLVPKNKAIDPMDQAYLDAHPALKAQVTQ